MARKRLAESTVVLLVLTLGATVCGFVFRLTAETFVGLCVLAVLNALLCELRLIRQAMCPSLGVNFHPQANLTDEEKQSIMRAAFKEQRRQRGWSPPKAGGYQPGVFD